MHSILLIRHAQSANNALPEAQRVPDPGLTELGKQQAERLTEIASRFQITELYCSPFRRSLDTTRPISHCTRLVPRIHSEIYEQGGCYSGYEPGKLVGAPGMNRAELEKEYPGWSICETIGANGWNHGRNYETDAEVRLRAQRVSDWLTHRWSVDRASAQAALVIHADFKRVLLETLLDGGRWDDDWQPIYNTSVSQLIREKGGWRLVEWNVVDHLDHELRSC